MPDVLAMATLVGVLAALIGVLAAVLQLRALGKQRRRDFEDLFVQRYWKIMDDLSLEALECTKPGGGVVSTTDRKAVIAFLTPVNALTLSVTGGTLRHRAQQRPVPKRDSR